MKSVPNPNGIHGKPIIVPNMEFDDALRRILTAAPAPKHATKATQAKKKATKKVARKRKRV